MERPTPFAPSEVQRSPANFSGSVIISLAEGKGLPDSAAASLAPETVMGLN